MRTYVIVIKEKNGGYSVMRPVKANSFAELKRKYANSKPPYKGTYYAVPVSRMKKLTERK